MRLLWQVQTSRPQQLNCFSPVELYCNLTLLISQKEQIAFFVTIGL